MSRVARKPLIVAVQPGPIPQHPRKTVDLLSIHRDCDLDAICDSNSIAVRSHHGIGTGHCHLAFPPSQFNAAGEDVFKYHVKLAALAWIPALGLLVRASYEREDG